MIGEMPFLAGLIGLGWRLLAPLAIAIAGGMAGALA